MSTPAQATVLSAADADRMGRAVVAALGRRNIRPGSRVVFSAGNSPELLAAIMGCLRGGYAPVVLAAGLTRSERTELVDSVSPALVLDDAACRGLTSAAQGGDAVQWAETFRCRPMHFTSGTSGRPKAVWSGWLSGPDAAAYSAEEIRAWGVTPADRHLVSAPLSHSAPLRFALHTLLAGGTVVIPPRFDPVLASQLIEHAQVTTAFMAPTHLQRLLEQAPPAAHRLRLLAHAGSSCPEAVKRAAITVFGSDVVVEFYGSTEGQFTICRSEEWLERPGTVGRARPGRRLRVDDGQIWCRVPGYARFEYWGDPAKTAAAWDGDWFTVGDLGRLDDEGFLYLDGRRSDLIISGGVNVYPAEVERILQAVAGVRQVCVVGVDDATWGQRVCAVAVGAVTTEELRTYATTHLAPYKRPKNILILDSLPVTHSGKIDRMRVAALFR